MSKEAPGPGAVQHLTNIKVVAPVIIRIDEVGNVLDTAETEAVSNGVSSSVTRTNTPNRDDTTQPKVRNPTSL